MRALVISGGGSKGAFAGGVAEHLIRVQKKKYDLFLGCSTGSLLVSHLALNKIEKIKKEFTEVTQEKIFDNSLLQSIQLIVFNQLVFITVSNLSTNK